MAEIPPAGGPADVSSMLDAWLAEDQGAVAGDWTPVEPGVKPAPAEQPADAAEPPPAADPLLVASPAVDTDVAAVDRAPLETEVELSATETLPAGPLPEASQPEDDEATPGNWSPLETEVELSATEALPADPMLEASPAGDGDVTPGNWAPVETETELPATEAPPAGPLPDAGPADGLDWVAGDWAPAGPEIASPPPEPHTEAPAGPVDVAPASPPALDAWRSDEAAMVPEEWPAVDRTIAAGPAAPAPDPPQAPPVAKGAEEPAPAEASTIDSWLNEERGADGSEWASADSPVTPEPEPRCSEPVVAPEPAPAGEAAPPPAASLYEAVSALDSRSEAATRHEAPPPGSEPERALQDRYVMFTVAGAQYAVQETFVTELDRVPKTTTVPNVPGWVRGVTNRRGDILSVIEIRGLLGLDRIAAVNERMLVVRLLDDSCSLGMLVDDVQQIVSVAAGDIRPPAATLEGPLAPFLAGLFEFNGKAVAVLDLDRMLRSEPVRQFDEPPEAD
jgi:purine-binding chemotaxis protein CheW